MEKLSVIIPAWQAENYLSEAVASIRTQDWPGEVELIIVDDGSADGTPALARKLGDIALTLPHGGAAKTRNAGLRISSGEWVLLLDADDVLAPGALEALYVPFAMRPELAAVFGLAEDFLSPELTEEQKRGLLCRRGSYGGILPGCALLRRQVFDRVGLFDERLDSGETVAWQMALRGSGLPTERINAVTLRRRIHLTNTGRVDRQQEMRNYAAILRRRMRKE